MTRNGFPPAACAPDSPAICVLVLGLPSGSPIPCGVSLGKRDHGPRVGPLSPSLDTLLFLSLRDLSSLAPEAECKLVLSPCSVTMSQVLVLCAPT